jgi:predicted DNA-binding ribbon-helix-helix protein
MRTTVRLDDTLLREAKSYAARRGVSLTALLDEALREKLSRDGQPTGKPPRKLPTFRGRGLQSGVELHCTAELEERMSADRR